MDGLLRALSSFLFRNLIGSFFLILLPLFSLLVPLFFFCNSSYYTRVEIYESIRVFLASFLFQRSFNWTIFGTVAVSGTESTIVFEAYLAAELFMVSAWFLHTYAF